MVALDFNQDKKVDVGAYAPHAKLRQLVTADPVSTPSPALKQRPVKAKENA